MNVASWKYFYKLDYINGHDVETNMLYTPLISPDGNVMCMWYDETSPYQSHNTQLSKEVIDFFFEREVKYLQALQEYEWAPRLLELDIPNRKIFIEFNKESLNYPLVEKGRSLDLEYPDWKDQIFNILKDLNDAGYYKMSIYPHCFFADTAGKIKTIDFYACVEKADCKIEKRKLAGMIGGDSTSRFDAATVGDSIDFGVFLKTTMLTHLGNTWIHDNPFPEFYKDIIGG